MRLSIEVARLENSSNVLKIAYLYCLKQPFFIWFHFPSEHFCSGLLFVFPSAFRAPRRVASSPRGQIPVSCLNFNVQSVMEDEGERATAALTTQTPRRAGPRAAHPVVRAGPPAPPAALSARAALQRSTRGAGRVLRDSSSRTRGASRSSPRASRCTDRTSRGASRGTRGASRSLCGASRVLRASRGSSSGTRGASRALLRVYWPA